MDREPENPAWKPREVDATKLRDGGIPADGCHDPGVAVLQRARFAIGERVSDRLRHVPALLHGDGNQHRQRSAAIGRAGEVTDHEYFWMSSYLHRRFNLDPGLAHQRYTGGLGKSGCFDARGPDHGARVYLLAVGKYPVGTGNGLDLCTNIPNDALQ